MALDVRKYKTDQNKEERGVWVEVDEGAWLKIARAGNENWQKEYGKLAQTVRNKMENGSLNNDRADKIVSDIMSKTILLDWQGLAEGGEEIPYSQKKAYEILYNYPDLRAEVMSYARNQEYFKDEAVETDLGN